MGPRRPLFLDRDGVLNRDFTPYIGSAEELELFPYTLDALEILDKAGYEFFVISNQQAVGRGHFPASVLDEQSAKIQAALSARGLSIRHIYYCTATSEENHPWRKPGCGMIFAARDEFGIDPVGAFLIGDRWSDIEAAVRAGCRPILVQSGDKHGEGWEEWEHQPERVFPTLLEAAEWIALLQ